jgi:hypothetical protein
MAQQPCIKHLRNEEGVKENVLHMLLCFRQIRRIKKIGCGKFEYWTTLVLLIKVM